MRLIMTFFLYNNTSLLISPLRPERVGVPPRAAAGQPYGNAGQRGETHYGENPCSLSSFEAKLSCDPIITLNPYNKEQTRQVNLIQSNLFDYGELGSGNSNPVLDVSSTAFGRRCWQNPRAMAPTAADGLWHVFWFVCSPEALALLTVHMEQVRNSKHGARHAASVVVHTNNNCKQHPTIPTMSHTESLNEKERQVFIMAVKLVKLIPNKGY